MECAPVRAQVWLDAHEAELGALPVPDAVARIEAAGLRARVVPYSGGRDAEEQRGDRVRIWLTEAGQVSAVDAG